MDNGRPPFYTRRIIYCELSGLQDAVWYLCAMILMAYITRQETK
jgi:hypothetical protein